MRLAALEINDAALVLADGTGVLASESGYAIAGDDLVFGAGAERQIRSAALTGSDRHWHDFGARPLRGPLQSFLTAADLVHAQLGELWSRVNARTRADSGAGSGHGGPEGLLLTTPPWWDEAQVDLFVALAREVGMPVRGLADGAIAATRCEYPGQDLLHLELSLHELTVTRVRQAGGASLGEREHYPGLGLEPLLRLVADTLARRFVECARFDPLHDASAEQRLFDRLPEWLPRIARSSEPVPLELEVGGGRYTATIAPAALRERLAGACEPLLQKLRAGTAARGPLALQLHHRLADFPGVVDSLAKLRDTTAHVLEPGAAARGALARAAAIGGPADAPGSRLSLRVSLPWDQPPAALPSGSAASSASARVPTHLLWGARVFRIGERPFAIGAELADGEYGVTPDPAARGVSRHHCTLRREAGVLMVYDHSRYGTWLNGHRIEGAAVLEVGDVLAVGSPAAEFRLVAEVNGSGP